MSTKTPRTWLASLLVVLVGCLFITVTGWLFATPAQEITTAVTSSGAQNVRSAPADSFVSAFTSVLSSADENQSAAYVATAKKMRPELSTQIDTAATEVETGPTDNDPNERHRVSRHRRRVPVCCVDEDGGDRQRPHETEYHTIYIPQSKVVQFLATHPHCRRGTCAAHGKNPET